MKLPEDIKRFLLLVPYVARAKGGVSVDELCENLEMDRKALHAFLERVCTVGAPDGSPDEMVEIFMEGDRVHVALPQRFTSPPRFSPEEVLALLLVLSPLRTGGATELAAHAEGLSERLIALASESAIKIAAVVKSNVLVQAQHDELPEHVAELERAIREHRVVKMEYYAATRDELKERTIRPCRLLQYRGASYVLPDDEKMYKIERIRALKVMEETFDPPAYLEPWTSNWQGKDGFEVAVRAAGEVHRYRESNKRSAINYIQAARGRLELEEPSELREALIADTQQRLRRYR